MNNLYNQEDVTGILNRFEKLTPDTRGQWGKMNVGQMLAHCSVIMETAMGEKKVKRTLLGKLIGGFFKYKYLGEEPLPKNSPTDKSYIFKDDRNFEFEKSKAIATIKRFMREVLQNVLKNPIHSSEIILLKNGQYYNGNI